MPGPCPIIHIPGYAGMQEEIGEAAEDQHQPLQGLAIGKRASFRRRAFCGLAITFQIRRRNRCASGVQTIRAEIKDSSTSSPQRGVLARSHAAITAIFILASMPGATQTQKALPQAKKPKTPTTTAVRLPDATSGQPYDARIVGIMGLAMGDFKCSDPSPALPNGLTLTCDTVLRISGTASPSSTGKTTSEIEITDVLKHTVPVRVEITVWPTSSTVVAGQAVTTANHQAAPAEPDYATEKIVQTQPLSEGGTAMSGLILPPLGKTADKHSARVWITNTDGTRSVAILKTKSDSSATAISVPLNSDSSYSLNLANPISVGQAATLTIVDPDGNEVLTAPSFRVDPTIPLTNPDLQIDSELIDGASLIAGRVAMPTPAIAPDNKIPPSFGNYPQIQVSVQDLATGQWSQAQVNSGSNPLTVQTDGSFSISLKSPLKTGQRVRLQAEPPFGRRFAGHRSQEITRLVLSATTLNRPTIATNLTEGATVISGTATPSSGGTQISVAILRLFPTALGETLRQPRYADVCFTADNMDQLQRPNQHGEPSTQSLESYATLLTLTNSGSSTVTVGVDQTGAYKVTLNQALKQDDYVQVVQVFPAGTSLIGQQLEKCASAVAKTGYPFSFHRTNIDFVAGVLISNSAGSSAANANFSQANQFYALNVDHAWHLPGSNCENLYARYIASRLEREAPLPPPDFDPCRSRGWHANKLLPGINTYFDSRLTSIPVSTAAANPPSGNSSQTSTSVAGTSTLLTSQKVFRVSTGLFLPWIITHGRGDHPTGLFVAPLAKVGFDTVTGARTATNVILPGNNIGSLNFQSAYNFYSFGGRVGNVELSSSPDRAPKIEHRLDVTIGRYSNLQSFICHALPTGTADQSLPGSSCTGDYSTPQNKITAWMESRKQLWRLDLEGLIRIPIPETAIPFYIGFNANIAQHAVEVDHLDHGYAPPDDIRILFATRIDMGSLLSALNIGAH